MDGPIPSTFRCLLCTAKVSLEMSLDCSLGCINSFWAKKEKITLGNLEKNTKVLEVRKSTGNLGIIHAFRNYS